MNASSRYVMKEAVKYPLSFLMKYFLQLATRCGFVRQIVRNQQWFIDERHMEIEGMRHECEMNFQQQLREFRESELAQQWLKFETILQNEKKQVRRQMEEFVAVRSRRTISRGSSIAEKENDSAGERIKYVEAYELMPSMLSILQQSNVVLDIGCGIMPQDYILPEVHICCEPYSQYVDVLKKKVSDKTDRNYVILNVGWSQSLEIFPEQSVDTVFICDVIEHLEKEEGRRLLEKTIAIARKQIVIFTPLGYMPQHHPDGKDAWGLDGGQWQEHKSGWNIEDFDDQWQFVISKSYHERDSLGNLLEKPFGAFWAIRTNRETENANRSFQEKTVSKAKNDEAESEIPATFASNISGTINESEVASENLDRMNLAQFESKRNVA